MADETDVAVNLQEAERERGIARARAAVRPDPVIGFCEACCDEDVPVLTVGNMPRCTPCRGRWEKRR